MNKSVNKRSGANYDARDPFIDIADDDVHKGRGKKKRKTWKRGRDAETGQFVDAEYVEANPKRTVTETVRRRGDS